MTIGEKIKYFRKRIGITQAKLAELSGIHPVSIRKYEIRRYFYLWEKDFYHPMMRS